MRKLSSIVTITPFKGGFDRRFTKTNISGIPQTLRIQSKFVCLISFGFSRDKKHGNNDVGDEYEQSFVDSISKFIREEICKFPKRIEIFRA